MRDPEREDNYGYDERSENHSLNDAVREPLFWTCIAITAGITGTVAWKIKDLIGYVLLEFF